MAAMLGMISPCVGEWIIFKSRYSICDIDGSIRGRAWKPYKGRKSTFSVKVKFGSVPNLGSYLTLPLFEKLIRPKLVYSVMCGSQPNADVNTSLCRYEGIHECTNHGAV